MFQWLFVLFILLSFQLQSKENRQPLVYSKEVILETFFRDLFDNSAAGYVLFGRKPVYLHSFLEPYKTIPGSKAHKYSVMSSLFLEIWKDFPDLPENSDYLLIGKDHEFLLINRNRFMNVVKDNLALFQYKMGIKTSPQGLLNSLLDPQNTFSSLFQEEIALQGIILGYGVCNSITYENGTHLIKSLKTSMAKAPYRLSPWPRSEGEVFQKLEAAFHQKKDWNRFSNEIKNLSFYHPFDKEDRLKVPFSFHPNIEESKLLLSGYREDQKNVDDVLSDENFLKRILNQFKISLFDGQEERLFTPEEKKRLSEVIAQLLVNNFQDELSPSFIDGMKAGEKGGSFQESKGVEFLKIQKGHGSNGIKISAPIGSQCLVPKKLYFQTIKQGSSEKVLSKFHSQIKIRYFIGGLLENKRGEKELLSEVLEVDLSDLIPGLAHGILGMGEGEVREVFIHPDFVYGADSDYFDGNPIKVKIELVQLGALSEENRLPLLIAENFHAPDISSCSQFLDLQNEYDYYCGATAWSHYKKLAPLIDLDTILSRLKNSKPREISSEEKRLGLKLEWFLYHQ